MDASEKKKRNGSYRFWRTITILWILILSVLYSALSIIRHNSFQSGAFDLGLFDQTVWQYAHGLYPYNTIKDRFILGDHLTLTLPLLAPLYWVKEDVRMLLVFQAVAITASAYAIFALARKREFSPFVSFTLACIYSLFYGIQFAVYFDFHPVVYGVALVTLVAYLTETNHRKLCIAAIILLLLTQENMGIALACLGCIYLFRNNRRKTGVWYIGVGIVASLAASKMITLLSPVGFQYAPSISLSPVSNVTQLFDSGEKRQVWFYSYAWFAFLPLFSIGSVLAVLLDLAQYFVTGLEFARMWSPFMHHRAILAPFLTLGLMDVFGWIRKRTNTLPVIAGILMAVVCIEQFVFHFPLNKLSKREYRKQEQWMADNRALIASVPADASVASQQNLVPHLSERKEIYLVYPRVHDFDDMPCGEKSCWWLDFPSHPTYLLVDTRPNQWLTQILESNNHWVSAIANMEKKGKITLEKQVGDARLYRVSY